jgi:hypothetical protein
MPNGPYSPFRVIYLGEVKIALKALIARAQTQGLGELLLKAIKANIARLRDAPLAFGEPCYRLTGLDLEVRLGASRGVSVIFAVDEKNRIVYVMSIRPMAGLGLK